MRGRGICAQVARIGAGRRELRLNRRPHGRGTIAPGTPPPHRRGGGRHGMTGLIPHPAPPSLAGACDPLERQRSDGRRCLGRLLSELGLETPKPFAPDVALIPPSFSPKESGRQRVRQLSPYPPKLVLSHALFAHRICMTFTFHVLCSCAGLLPPSSHDLLLCLPKSICHPQLFLPTRPPVPKTPKPPLFLCHLYLSPHASSFSPALWCQTGWVDGRLRWVGERGQGRDRILNLHTALRLVHGLGAASLSAIHSPLSGFCQFFPATSDV